MEFMGLLAPVAFVFAIFIKKRSEKTKKRIPFKS